MVGALQGSKLLKKQLLRNNAVGVLSHSLHCNIQRCFWKALAAGCIWSCQGRAQ